MITTGSKLLIGSAVVAMIAAIVYGLAQDGVMGTVGLSSAAVSLTVLAVLNVLLRDSNVFVDDDAPVETSAAAQYAPRDSVWPLGFAFGGVVVAVGLVTFQPILIIGLIVVLAAGAEWAVTAWSERASSDVAHNREVRSRISNPFEFPLGGAIAIGIIIYAFSRLMLWLSKTNTVVAFSVLAAIVLAVAFAFAMRPSIKSGAIGGTVAVAAVAIVASGAAAGLDGEREIREFETTSIYQEEAIAHPGEFGDGLICESPEEFEEADEDASQTVAAKSGTYEVVLTEGGTLTYDLPGPVFDTTDGITIPRSNPSNIIFRNQYDEPARLSVDLGIDLDTTGLEDEATGETSEAPIQICTTIVEPGGAQLLTLSVGVPSVFFDGVENANGPAGPDGDGYWFFVPGVESAKLELIVP